MQNNAENIEARLCAYVEGDLDGPARAELETHLAANPPHRALLEELRRTKSLMQALPREVAPPEMTETLQGQLERSVLLDGVGAGDLGAPLRINRMPQLLAVAAVVLLAAGLGAVVYLVLPAHSASTVAFNENKDREAKIVMPQDGASSSPTVELGKLPAKDDATYPVARGEKTFAKASAGESPKAINDQVDHDNVSELNKMMAASPTPPAASNGQSKMGLAVTVNQSSRDLKNEGEAEGQRVCVIVSTDNLAATNSHLETYLRANNIAWQPADQALPGTPLNGGLANESRANAQRFQLKQNGTVDNNTLVGNNATNTLTNSLNSNGDVNAFNSRNGFAAQKADRQAGTESPPGTIGGRQSQGQIPGEKASAGQASGGQASAGQVFEGQQAGASPISPATRPAFDLAGSNAETVIVAHGLTRRQASELSDSLARSDAARTAVVVDGEAKKLAQAPADLASSPSTQPSAVANDAAWASLPAVPTTNPSTAPTTGPTLAESLGFSTTQPAKPIGDDASIPATQPSYGQALQLTQSPMDEPVDVMIVVQAAPPTARSAAPPAAIPMPATQPVVPTTEPSVPIQVR